MFNLVLTLAAYTAIVTVVTFIAVYSKMYDWHRHPMGRVMNFSLLSVTLVALGGIIRTHADVVGMMIVSGGWILFSILLVWRLRLLIVSWKQGKHSSKPGKLYNEEQTLK